MFRLVLFKTNFVDVPSPYSPYTVALFNAFSNKSLFPSNKTSLLGKKCFLRLKRKENKTGGVNIIINCFRNLVI
jgi:hypothetical protein